MASGGVVGGVVGVVGVIGAIGAMAAHLTIVIERIESGQPSQEEEKNILFTISN